MMERKREMGFAHFARRIKQPRGIWVKMTFIVVLGLCFVFFWSFLSSSASLFNVQRESFDDIAEPVSFRTKSAHNVSESSKSHEKGKVESGSKSKEGKKAGGFVHKHETKKKKEHAVSHPHKKKDVPKPVVEEAVVKEEQVEAEFDDSESNKEDGEEGTESDGNEGEIDGNGDDSNASVDEEVEEKNEEVTENEIGKKKKRKGPVFDSKAEYIWRLCNTRSKYNYMPCTDNDGLIGRL